ncbi:MAG TPA: hypothetical protein VFW05_10675 [Verrucomicrobiae bacterium]|nr:hypothetical protein [Verrucomicrobiae bacterium]
MKKMFIDFTLAFVLAVFTTSAFAREIEPPASPEITAAMQPYLDSHWNFHKWSRPAGNALNGIGSFAIFQKLALFISDMMMAVMGRSKAIAALRQINPLLKSIRINPRIP